MPPIAYSDIKILKEFRDLIPKLTESEENNLKEELEAYGQRDPLVIWREKGSSKFILVDGHNRFRILSKMNPRPKIKTVAMKFDTKIHARNFIIKNQLSRRNISTFTKYLLAKEYMEEVKGIAKEKQKTSTGGKAPKLKPQLLHSSTKAEPINTAKTISKLIGTSTNSLHRLRYIDEHGDNEVKQLLIEGKASINRCYSEVKGNVIEKEKNDKEKVSRKKRETIDTKCNYEIYHGDALEVIPTLADNLIDSSICSPPYFSLRSSLGNREKGKAKEIGTEKTVEEYISNLSKVFYSLKSKLKPKATVWVVIGDSYNNKDLLGIPWLLAFELKRIGYILRSDIIWGKPDPQCSSVKDRVTISHEYIFMFTISKNYYYDADIIREDFVGEGVYNSPTTRHSQSSKSKKQNGYDGIRERQIKLKGGRNKRSLWICSTGRNSDHHSAFPERLIEPCILAGCPEDGLIIDPFCGSGTTGLCALKNRRNFIGVELSKKYAELSKNNLAEISEKS